MARSIPGAEYRAVARKHHPRHCVVCGAVNPLDVHHKNGNHADNRPGNLEWRCRAHHLQAHGKRVQTPFVVSFATEKAAKKALPSFKGTGSHYRVKNAIYTGQAPFVKGKSNGHGLGTAVLVLVVLFIVVAVL